MGKELSGLTNELCAAVKDGLPTRMDVKPALLQWALDRSRQTADQHVQSWIDGKTAPTLRQLETFAKKTHVPFGYLLLREPPKDTLPWPGPPNPSGSLVDFAHEVDGFCEYIRDLRAGSGADELPIVGREARMSNAIRYVRSHLCGPGPGPGLRPAVLRGNAETAGVVVIAPRRNRPGALLDPSEFSGMVRADKFAPVVAINGRSTVAVRLSALCAGLAYVAAGITCVIMPDGQLRFGAASDGHEAHALRAGLAEMTAARRIGWPPISNTLADEVFAGARSGTFTYLYAWRLVGVKAFRQAEAREAARAGWTKTSRALPTTESKTPPTKNN